MFDLMGAIRRRQENKTPPPAEAADSAESPQPHDLEAAEKLRKVADFSAGENFSAAIRKNPQTQKRGKPASTLGLGAFSANPQFPQPAAERKEQNPDTLLIEIAQTLEASPNRLRALLSDDDMRDIAEGATSRANLLAYFRLMRSDGHPLANDPPEPTRAPPNRPGHVELMQAWKPAHDDLINHLMACKACYAPRARYCKTGANLNDAYKQSCKDMNKSE